MAGGESMAQQAAGGRIVQINISHGGVPKLPIEVATVGPLGIEGDYHNDVRDHGGPTRALCLFTLQEIERLQGEGHPIAAGTVGENVTLAGIELGALVPGTRLQLGDEVRIEIASYAVPCKTIRESFSDYDFTRISHKLHLGESRVFARVLRGGVMRPGDPVRMLTERSLTETA
jgi:MOSC domain-containing protein YiiM